MGKQVEDYHVGKQIEDRGRNRRNVQSADAGATMYLPLGGAGNKRCERKLLQHCLAFFVSMNGTFKTYLKHKTNAIFDGIIACYFFPFRFEKKCFLFFRCPTAADAAAVRKINPLIKQS